MTAATTRLLALDWGTTSLRAHRLADGGSVLETRLLPRGIMHLARPLDGATQPASGAPTFDDAFEEACGDWLRATPGVPVIACGMVGSAQGWREAAYLDVPTSFERLAAQLTRVEAANGAVVHIVPGLIERGRLPNVLRGEETQILGALDAAARAFPPDSTTLVGLPGTHSKWAVVRGRQVVHFDTFMTGEVYDALCSHTLLGRTLRRTAEWDRSAFDRGAAVARSPEGRAGISSTIFSTRTLGLTGVLSAEAQADYLSGLLIGHELHALEALDRHAFDGVGGIVLIGADALCERYRRVLASITSAVPISTARQATERGCWRLACDAGLVPASSKNAMSEPLGQALSRLGLLAILRGVRPDEVRDIGGALYAAGWRALEVPLNSPDPLSSLRALREALPADCVIGAGTVTTPAQVEEVRAAGGQFIVMPHADASVIRAGKAAGLEVAAGAATITEAFGALGAGADIIKMFPADQLGPATLAAWRAVLPKSARVIAVGGVGPSELGPFIAAGAVGFGIGSALYRPGRSGSDLSEPARDFIAAWQAAMPQKSAK